MGDLLQLFVSQNHHELGWKGLERPPGSSHLPWVGTPSVRPGCSEPSLELTKVGQCKVVTLHAVQVVWNDELLDGFGTPKTLNGNCYRYPWLLYSCCSCIVLVFCWVFLAPALL